MLQRDLLRHLIDYSEILSRTGRI